MYKFKKVTALSIALIFVVSASLAGCGKSTKESQATTNSSTEKKALNLNETGFPIVKEPISLKMVARKNTQHGEWKDMAVLNDYAKKTGIKVEYEVFPQQGFEEKKNLLFASNEMPDAFINSGLNANDQMKSGPNGLLIPMEGLVDKYGPNIKALFTQYPDVRKTISDPKGHIYALATTVTQSAARTQKLWLNMDILQKINKPVPQTSEELYIVLKAAKEADPNIIPFAMAMVDASDVFGCDGMRGMEGIWGLQRQFNGTYNIENGKVKNWLDDDKYRNLVEYLSKLYKEKLLDQDCFTMDAATNNAKKKASKTVMHFEQTDGYTDTKKYQGIAYPKGPYGDPIANGGPIARDLGAFAITNVNKYPEATMRWVDYFYGDEGSIYLRYGIEGVQYTKKPDGTPEYKQEIMNDPKGYAIAIGQFTTWPGGGAPHWINDKNSSAVTSAATMEAQKKIEKFMQKDIYGALLLPDDMREKYLTLYNDIYKFSKESFSRFVLEGVTDAKWNEYKATLQKMGIRDLEAMQQKAFDALK